MKIVIDTKKLQTTPYYAKNCVVTMEDIIKCGTPLKKGHWIVEVWTNREHHTCSVCQMVVNYEPCYHYCPYCGAEMESD